MMFNDSLMVPFTPTCFSRIPPRIIQEVATLGAAGVNVISIFDRTVHVGAQTSKRDRDNLALTQYPRNAFFIREPPYECCLHLHSALPIDI